MGAYPGHNVSKGGGGSKSSGGGSSSGGYSPPTAGELLFQEGQRRGQNPSQYPESQQGSLMSNPNFNAGYRSGTAGYGGGQRQAPTNTPESIREKARGINAQIQEAQRWKNEGVPKNVSSSQLRHSYDNSIYTAFAGRDTIDRGIKERDLEDDAGNYPLGKRVTRIPEADLKKYGKNAVPQMSYPQAKWYVNPLTGAKYAGRAAAVERQQMRSRGENPDFVHASMPSRDSMSSLGGYVGGSNMMLGAPSFKSADLSYGIDFGLPFEQTTTYGQSTSYGESTSVTTIGGFKVPPMFESTIGKISNIPNAFGWSALGGVFEQNVALKLNPLGVTKSTLSGMGKGAIGYLGYEIGRTITGPIAKGYYDVTSGIAGKLPTIAQEPFLALTQSPGIPGPNVATYYAGKQFRGQYFQSQGVSSKDIATMEKNTFGEKFGSGGTFGKFGIATSRELGGFAAAGGTTYIFNKAIERLPTSIMGGKALPYIAGSEKGVIGAYSGGGSLPAPNRLERVFITGKGVKQFPAEGQKFTDTLAIKTSQQGTDYQFTRQIGSIKYTSGSTRPMTTASDQFSTPFTFTKRIGVSMPGGIKVSPAGVRLPGGSAAVTFARGQNVLEGLPAQDFKLQQIFRMGGIEDIRVRGLVSEFKGGRIVTSMAQNPIQLPPFKPNVAIYKPQKMTGKFGGQLFKEIYGVPTKPTKTYVSPQGAVAEYKVESAMKPAVFHNEAASMLRQGSRSFSMYKYNPLYASGVGYETVSRGGRVLSGMMRSFSRLNNQALTQTTLQPGNQIISLKSSSVVRQGSSIKQIIETMFSSSSSATSSKNMIRQVSQQFSDRIVQPRQTTQTIIYGGNIRPPKFDVPKIPAFKMPGVPPVGGGGSGGVRDLFKGEFKIRKNTLLTGTAAFKNLFGGIIKPKRRQKR
jgi:hypothetical protein